jgi:hypothetical protein
MRRKRRLGLSHHQHHHALTEAGDTSAYALPRAAGSNVLCWGGHTLIAIPPDTCGIPTIDLSSQYSSSTTHTHTHTHYCRGERHVARPLPAPNGHTPTSRQLLLVIRHRQGLTDCKMVTALESKRSTPDLISRHRELEPHVTGGELIWSQIAIA